MRYNSCFVWILLNEIISMIYKPLARLIRSTKHFTSAVFFSFMTLSPATLNIDNNNNFYCTGMV